MPLLPSKYDLYASVIKLIDKNFVCQRENWGVQQLLLHIELETSLTEERLNDLFTNANLPAYVYRAIAAVYRDCYLSCASEPQFHIFKSLDQCIATLIAPQELPSKITVVFGSRYLYDSYLAYRQISLTENL